MKKQEMKKSKTDLILAEQHLKKKDRILCKIIDMVGHCELHLRLDIFQALVESIIHQQLSIKAAATIFHRFKSLYPDAFPDPKEIIDTSFDKLRGVGISRNKVGFLKDLSQKFTDGTIDPSKFSIMSDEEIIEHLIQVKGIGLWSSEMFLIFSMGRLNVLPLDDIGFKRAVQLQYGSKYTASKEKLKKLGEKWSPYCSVATWYLWKSLDLDCHENV